MDRIINWLLLVIIFVFDPLAISLVVAANFAFAQLIPKTKENIYGEKIIISNDNEGSDIYTKDELKDWDTTLSDGLEDEEWDEDHALDQVLNDIVEDSNDWEIVDEEPQIKVKMSGEPSLNMLSEEEKKYDTNNDGVLDNQEKARFAEEKLLNNPGISSWRKKKIRDYLDGKTKSYW